MAEQQYRVIADRDKGDDPLDVIPQAGDLITYRFDGRVREGHGTSLVRIERPVPPTDEPQDDPQDLRTQVANLVPLSMLDGRDSRANVFEVADEIIPVVLASVRPPTREQIAEVLYRESSDWKLHRLPWSTVLNMADPVIRDGYFRRADAVLALLQKGADRG